METLKHFADLANHLHQEEADFTPPSVPWHARNTLHFHERAYYLCSPGCGKPFVDIASKRRHQAQCKAFLGHV
jgi:hypothetical protein